MARYLAVWLYLVALGLVACTVGGSRPTSLTPPPTTPAPPATAAATALPAPPASSSSAADCPVTPFASDRPSHPNTAAFTDTWYRNPEGTLWAGLHRTFKGKWYAATGHKVLWAKGTGLPLQVRARRLDGTSPPAEIDIPDGYRNFPYQASSLTFPTPGCWEVEGVAGPHRIRFVIWVLPADQKPLGIP
ncbi:hypothetical protein [Thermoflexus sp.]|uniref:hypothetical protein n=1 Tax=Thermoflexus sp. TaxID=1969742 RepID=UPI0035E45ABD